MHPQGSLLTPQMTSDNSGVTALLLFDYDYVGLPGEDSVFGAIRACLERSEGVCALNDAGLLSSKALENFTYKAVQTRSASAGLLDHPQSQWMQPSAAAIWTDRPENVQLFHRYLDVHAGPRYRGAVLVDDSSSFADFLRFCAQWSPGATSGGGGLAPRMRAAGMAAWQALVGRAQAWHAAIMQRISPGGALAGYLGAGVGVLLFLVVLFFIAGGDPEITPIVEHSADRKVEARAAAQREVTATAIETTEQEPRIDAALREDASGAAVESAAEREQAAVVSTSRNGRDRATSSAVPAPAFSVQVGSFRQPGSASALADRLTADGYPTSVSTVKLAGGATMHRVRVGAFGTRREARLFGEQLIRQKPFVRQFFVAVRE